MELTLGEAKNILQYIIKNNSTLQEKGQFPIAVSLRGDAGLGKSAICDQIAQEMDANYIKLNLSQLSDPSDIVGFPYQEFHICKDDRCEWIGAKLIEAYTANGWTITPETRTTYAVPEWVQGLDANKPTICVLDDYTRTTPAIQAAVMEIIYQQRYISWQLPKNSTIILTENPNDGSYCVNELDAAMQSRYMCFDVKFDIDCWSQFAEETQIDGRA